MMFACKMYAPSLTNQERGHRVDDVLANLGLEGCQHTKVGGHQLGPTWHIATM